MSVEQIRRILCGEPVEADDAPIRRLALAIRDDPRRSVLDTAVLVRHALRHSALNNRGDGITLPVDCAFLDARSWTSCGMQLQTLGQSTYVVARPWLPDWLADVGPDGVDANAARGDLRNVLEPAARDPFLADFERGEYRSPGQRAVIRAALTTPPGGTLLVCLPTGEGKSFVFQVASTYAGARAFGAGVTLVVIPTVTLAHDQAEAARRLGLPDIPRAYVGGSDIDNGAIADRIAAGTQGLCFASPEAVCTTLRTPLMKASEAGMLRAFVIDEAHLVDAWGANFRPEFQVLSGIRYELLRAAPAHARPITLLLSATLTEETVRTLRRFFAIDASGEENHETFRTCAAARLRPEIEYWVADTAEFEHHEPRIREALRHVPRPVILYTTKVTHAERWYERLFREGFRRLALVTGKTSDEQREQVVKSWREGTLDLVVATSAFGLGIDNANVRTVIHSCLPETLDRFYQEVGRGGRDARVSLSILLAGPADVGTAESLNNPRKISVDRGFSRWRSMFHHPSRVQKEEALFSVRLDVPPGEDAGDLDMRGKESIQWNARTLTLMASGRLIQLCGAESHLDEPGPAGKDGKWHPAQTVRILDPTHLDKNTWESRVEPERLRLAQAMDHNLEAMKRFLARERCSADILGPLYEVPDRQHAGHPLIPVARACGGCPACRRAGRRWWSDPCGEPPQPWPADSSQTVLQAWFDHAGCLVVFCPRSTFDDTASSRQKRRLSEAMARHGDRGLACLVLLDEVCIDTARIQHETRRPLFVADQLPPNGLPKGPCAIFVTRPQSLRRMYLGTPRPAHEGRIVFAPDDCPDPVRAGVMLKESYSGRQMSLEDFLERTLG